MERKAQEHKQEMERLQQTTELQKQRLIHEAKLKKEAAEVREEETLLLLGFSTAAGWSHADTHTHTHTHTHTQIEVQVELEQAENAQKTEFLRQLKVRRH